MRIISSTHGPQRASEGDVIRLGLRLQRAHQRLHRHAHRLASLPAAQIAALLDRERFDVLHFHEPFVPLPVAQFLLRESHSVNVATFHAYAGWSPAYEFGQRFMGRFAAARSTAASRSAPRRATSSTATSRATTRSSPTASTWRRSRTCQPIARWRDGTPNILFVGRFESRKGLMYLLQAYSQLRRSGS